MDSDSGSDSDGSHISATPPRDLNSPKVPKPSLPSPKHPKPSLLTSKPKTRPKNPSSKPRTTPNSNPNPNPTLSRKNAPEEPILSPLSSLPFRVLRPSDQPEPVPALGGIDMLPAGYFSISKRSSFSKLNKKDLSFESPLSDSGNSKPEPVTGSGGMSDGSLVVKHRRADSGKSTKAAARLNLIKGNVPLPPVKLKKCSNEGNFVRLNLNGRKRKFVNKGKSYKSAGRFRYSGRSKRGRKVENGASEEGGFVDEDGLVTDVSRAQESGEVGYSETGLVEAVLAARNNASDENLMRVLKLVYGYDSFRDGQLEAIKMVLDGKSTMLVLPTGAGKSLCYQIPAMILPGITLVVIPLVALMIDQLKQLPRVVHGGLLSSNQTLQETSETLRLLQEGVIKVLFVSPERFLNEEFLSLFTTHGQVSLVVVDEAHCISEWSHNFRPSYTRLRANLLRAKLHVDCILAMTATATRTTLCDIMSALEIPSENLIQKAQLRDNLQLSISTSQNRMKDLLCLLKSPPFSEIHSIIVYCKFQSETDLVSRYLCDNNIPAKSYHGGIPAKHRNRVQELFCSNKLRVVVATVAFGMGLDKRDVGAVIHYSLPNSLEEYVQEIGRAGRDGTESSCHLFLDDSTYFKLRSLMHSDGVDEYAVNKFLSQVFTSEPNSHGKVRSIVKDSASHKFDMKEEVMLTILTHLELGEVQYLLMLPQVNVTYTLNFHQTAPELFADKDIVVAAILKRSQKKQGQYVFDILEVANSLGVTPAQLCSQLQHLKLKGEITYDSKDPAYCYRVLKSPEDIFSLSVHLIKWLSEVERCKVSKLDAMYNAAFLTLNGCKMQGFSDSQHTPYLQRKIMDYFNGDCDFDGPSLMKKTSPFLRADIKVFLQSNSHAKFTPRAIARIFHGIGSPSYPISTWGKTHFWGRYIQVDFKEVIEAAKAELMSSVAKNAV